jgi:1,4-alpha-glucan branching enzyme
MTHDPFEKSVEKIISAKHGDPFSFLGMHWDAGAEALVIRAFVPEARRTHVIDVGKGAVVGELAKVHEAGFFAGPVANSERPFRYRLRIETDEGETDIEDPYRFGPILGDMDVYSIAEGKHLRLDEKLGAHPMVMDDVHGVGFSVWAPNALRVSVIGDFNNWDGRRHPMRFRVECGVWELFVPQVHEGALYKFEVATRKGELLALKLDPFAFFCEQAPGTAGVVYDLDHYQWGDDNWLEERGAKIARDAPISIYEVHLGSWRRSVEKGNNYLSYAELAESLVSYVADLGFTHIELLPVSEHPFDGSWGYQPLGLFAPTSRFGRPDEFRLLVDRCHQAGIGVIADWVPAHFPTDPHALGYFDGSCLYEISDPRQDRQHAWGTLSYNYARYEVADYLINNALFWTEEYHLDGLRIDSVASMLYLDYSRRPGEWAPNPYGGNENLEAIAFLRRLNEVLYEHHPDIATFAEESTAWPMVSRPTYLGGLGFGFKWNLGWIQDTLGYMNRDPVFRKYIHDRLTFGIMYAFSENFLLPISHNDVVHGRGSLVGKMPGDRWQRFANLRVYYTFMWTHPGKKLLFMGGEFAQEREWDHNSSLDWHLLADPQHAGVRNLIRDLNHLYREVPAFHQFDCEAEGFEWIDCTDVDSSVISFLRKGRGPSEFAVVVCNFTPVIRRSYRIGVPEEGFYVERLNSDSAVYGGSDVGNAGGVLAAPIRCHDRPYSIDLTLPPLAALVLILDRNQL